MQRFTSRLLLFAVLFSGLQGVGAHQHTADALEFGTACLIDHEHDLEEHHPETPHVEESGDLHEHDCVACAASRHRSDLSVQSDFGPERLVAKDALPELAQSNSRLLATRLGARGPPLT